MMRESINAYEISAALERAPQESEKLAGPALK